MHRTQKTHMTHTRCTQTQTHDSHTHTQDAPTPTHTHMYTHSGHTRSSTHMINTGHKRAYTNKTHQHTHTEDTHTHTHTQVCRTTYIASSSDRSAGNSCACVRVFPISANSNAHTTPYVLQQHALSMSMLRIQIQHNNFGHLTAVQSNAAIMARVLQHCRFRWRPNRHRRRHRRHRRRHRPHRRHRPSASPQFSLGQIQLVHPGLRP